MKAEGQFMGEMLVFGYVAAKPSASTTDRMAQFSIELGKLAGSEMVILEAKSYDDLAACVHRHEVDVAWLPPIPFLALDRRKEVVPIVSNHRDGGDSYNSVVIVHASSLDYEPGDLVGKRAAWVDPRSAAGYVLPRIELAEEHLDLSTFGAEKFFGSHDEVAIAVIEKRADFGATYAGFDSEGALLRGPWMDIAGGEDSVRILAAFGAIPGDCIAARADLTAGVREKVTSALVRVSHEKVNRLLVRDIFGVDEFRRWHPSNYDELRDATMRAAERGLLSGEEKRVDLFVA